MNDESDHDCLVNNLKQAHEVTFKYLTEPERQLLIACKTHKNSIFFPVRRTIRLTESEAPRLTKECERWLNEKVPVLVQKYCTAKLKYLTFCNVDDRLPDFINSVLNSILSSKLIVLKKLTIDNCAFDLRHTASDLPNSIFDAGLLNEFLISGKTHELYIDLEDFLYTNEPEDEDAWELLATRNEAPLVQSAASCEELVQALTDNPHESSLKVLSLSWTPQLEIHQLVAIVEAQTNLQELVLYNAFKEREKIALTPFVDALKTHPKLQKLTFLHSRMDSSTYKWALYSVLEGNQGITSLCTDGFYSDNAAWLARLLRSNTQLKAVNLSHPEFDSDQYRRSGNYGSALSLIRGIETARSRLIKVNLMGLDLGEEGAKTLRNILQDPKSTIQSLVCGSMTTTPSNFALVVGGLITNKSVKKFTIRSLNLDPIGAQTVADVIIFNSCLESLVLGASQRRYRLRRRRTGTEQEVAPLAALIASALANNCSLKALALPTNMNENDSISQFQNCLQHSNRTLERLQFWPKTPCENESIMYLTRLNQCGRGTLLSGDVPVALWAHVFASSELDTLRYFVQECPAIISQVPTTQTAVKRKPCDVGISTLKKAKK